MRAITFILALLLGICANASANQPTDNIPLKSPRYQNSVTGFESKFDSRSKKIIFLCALVRDCKKGNTYIYSNAIEITPSFWIHHREELLEKFEKIVDKHFPQNTIEVSVDSIVGFFNTKEEAYRNQRITISQQSHQGNVFLVDFTLKR
ncbi:MAG: hypothetical protein OHK0038_18610 [Flammeovirgaceae bacterium]